MDNKSEINKNYNSNHNHFGTKNFGIKNFYGKSGYSPVNFSLTAEVGRNFFSYLKSLNLENYRNFFILPSNDHYFYNEEELRCIRIIINLRRMNLIDNLEKFLQNLDGVLPLNVNFIGCFSESKYLDWGEIPARLSIGFNNFFFAGSDRLINKKQVSELLEKFGFQIVNMQEISGLTYFHSLKVS